MFFMKIGEFSAHYDGEAVASHEMDVTALGPSLLAFGDLARSAHRVIDPFDAKQPVVKVKEFKSGSFEIVMGIDLTLLEEAVNLFTGKHMTAVANSIAVGTSIVGLICATIKILKKQANEHREFSRDELVSELQDELLAGHVDKLRKDRQFRDAASRLVSPLADDRGLDELELRNSTGERIVSISSSDAGKMIERLEETAPVVRYETALIEIATPPMLKPLKRKWGIVHPEYGSVNAALRDEEFAQLTINGGASFRAGQKFKAQLRVEETVDSISGELKQSFEIAHIEPVDGPEQLDLPGDDS